MPNNGEIEFKEVDLAPSVAAPPSGIMAVSLVTKRGKINDPSLVIKSWPEFMKYFGGLVPFSEGPTLCKKALDRGAGLRVNRISHYNDINVAIPSAVLATMKPSSSLTFTATNLKASDSILATINGTPGTAVAFSTSHNYTMQLIANQLKVDFPLLVQDAKVLPPATPGGNSRTILVGYKTGAMAIVTFTMVVTGAPAVPTVSHTTISALVNAGAIPLMGLTPYERGAAYNQLFVYVLPPSNRNIQYFDLIISLLDEPTAVENYPNLRLRAVATKEEQVDMARLNNSTIAEWTVPDLTGVTDLAPLSAIFGFQGGTDGGTITASDYIGSQVSKTGFNAFDLYGDMTALATLDKSILDVAITQAGAAYATTRKDIVYMAHVDNSLTNENTINSAIDALLIDSSYVGFYGGGNKTTNPDTAAKIQISELGDILGLIAYTHKNFGFHYSFAGVNRGIIPNSTGPVNNFGEIGQKDALNTLAQNRVNMVILRNKRIYLKGNFTAQVALSPLSFMSIRFFLNGLKKALAPTLENYQEEPCEPGTWLKLYYEIRPYMETLADKKALHGKEGIGWRWDGDQFVTNLNDLAVNNANDVGLGKYRVRLFVKPVNSIQEIEVSIIITPGGVTFEEAAALL